MKNVRILLTLTLPLVLLGASSCSQSPSENVGIDLKNMDTSVSPADDFYNYVNGGWMESNAIPEDRGRWGSFDELRKKNNAVVLEVLEKATQSGQFAEGSDEMKVAEFYAVGMDTVLAEERGIQPIQPYLNKIDALTSTQQLQTLLQEMHIEGFDPFFGIGVMPDLMNSTMNAVYLVPSGLGLPNRDYYTKSDSVSVELRQKYVAHIGRMLSLTNAASTDAEIVAQRIYKLELNLANSHYTPLQQRDLSIQYNPKSVAELQEMTSSIQWRAYLDQTAAEKAETLVVMNPAYMLTLDSVLNNAPLNDLKWYVKWRTIDRAANFLNAAIVQANFDFFSKEMDGVSAMKPRWETVLGVTNGALGEALGKLYVAEVFPPEAKVSAEAMVQDVVAAFKNRIEALDWMTDSTKVKALEKLSKFTVKIGYPDQWKDYSTLEVGNSGATYSYFQNVINAAVYGHYDAMAKIGKEVDRAEWGMTPQTVNAYYSPLKNEIVFPAAILQPPFYDYRADEAVNYGGIGAVIGHEISHGFDDKGSKFDANGNMINWWTEKDRTEFEQRTKKLVDQFDAFEPLPGVYVQGAFTLGENIGDLGGINTAYDALQIYLNREGRPQAIDGFTPEQRLFLSWGTIWRTKVRDEKLRSLIQSDTHSPGYYRAFAPLKNMETFYAAFDVKEGNKMWIAAEDRVKIW